MTLVRDSDMKNTKLMLFLFVMLMFIFTACGKHQHIFNDVDCQNPAVCLECKETIGEALGHTAVIGVCSRCGEIGNEELLNMLNTNYEQMTEIGTILFSCLSDVNALDDNMQYENFLKADKYIIKMASIYEKMLMVCMDYEELDTITYQLKLLKNSCPIPISDSDATSLINQKFLYSLYLQQLSSSCSYISESLDYLTGNRKQQATILYFEEVSDMPTPDSIIYGIWYDTTKNDSGNIQYTYLIGDNEIDAMLNYNLYLHAIESGSELKVDISDSMAMIYQNGKMVSVMMAGNDTSKGYFLTISFRK